MNTDTHKNGCNNRPPLAKDHAVTGGGRIASVFSDKPCEYTKSGLGQQDKGCIGCVWRGSEAV